MMFGLRSHRFAIAMLITLGAAAGVRAAEGDGPTPYPDPKDQSAWPGKGPIRVFGWMTQNRQYYWSQREKAKDSVVFVGDSLTANWKTLKDAFPDLKVANRGIGGDVSRGVLFRFKEDVLALSPKAIVICIGTNDLSAHAKPADIESNIAEIVAQAREHSATLPIILCTIPPRDSKESPLKEGALDDTNERIRKLAEGKEHIALVDLYKGLLGEDGKLVDEYYSKDKVHLAPPAYAKWAELLKPALEALNVK